MTVSDEILESIPHGEDGAIKQVSDLAYQNGLLQAELDNRDDYEAELQARIEELEGALREIDTQKADCVEELLAARKVVKAARDIEPLVDFADDGYIHFIDGYDELKEALAELDKEHHG